MFWMVLVSARWLRDGATVAGDVAAGALAALTLVMKPTQLYLMPWFAIGMIALPASRAKVVRAFGGGALLLGVLALSYSLVRSPAALIADHREWVQFLQLSTAKHLLGFNNYGLPTLLTRLGLGAVASDALFVPVTLLITAAVAWHLRSNRQQSLDVSQLLLLAFSPMAWKANFGVFIALAYELASSLERNERKAVAMTGVLSILLVAKASEYWLGDALMRNFGAIAAPVWLITIAIFCRATLDEPRKAAR
jgi:hypothetical protein